MLSTSHKNGQSNRENSLENEYKELENAVGKINISTPWGNDNVASQKMFMCRSEVDDVEALRHFVERRSRVHEMWIQETHKTKRTTLYISALLFIVAASILVFSPTEKEMVAYSVSGVLILLSAGIGGYGFFKMNAKELTIEAKNVKS